MLSEYETFLLKQYITVNTKKRPQPSTKVLCSVPPEDEQKLKDFCKQLRDAKNERIKAEQEAELTRKFMAMVETARAHGVSMG